MYAEEIKRCISAYDQSTRYYTTTQRLNTTHQVPLVGRPIQRRNSIATILGTRRPSLKSRTGSLALGIAAAVIQGGIEDTSRGVIAMIIQRTFVGIVATNEFVGTKTGRRDALVAGTGLVVVAIDFRRVDDALSRGILTDVNAVAFVVILA